MDPAVRIFVVAIVGGILAQWCSRLIRLPALIPLLLFGIIAGPHVLGLTPTPSAVIPAAFLGIVELGVVIILFDGGLSLNLQDIRAAPLAVRNLLTIGASLTFAGATACARYLGGLTWPAAALFGSLIIVTGPTVIMPLLHHVRLTRRVHTVLLWEGILIDAVGAIAAVVTLDVVVEGHGWFHVGGGFMRALLFGPALGAIGGWLLAWGLRRRMRKGRRTDDIDHLLALAGALSIYGLSETVSRNSGFGAVIAAGLVVSNTLGPAAEDLRRAKSRISRFYVSVLFMLLAADFHVTLLLSLWPRGFLVVLVLVFVVRPLAVWLSCYRSRLAWRERLYVSCVCPRGIVAASVASVFALLLRQRGEAAMGEQLLGLTFLTIMITVLVASLVSYPLARLLGLGEKKRQGLLIVGANELGLRLAGLYEIRGLLVLFIDTNPRLCAQVRLAGFPAAEGSALDGEFLAQQNLAGIGALLAATPSSFVNARVATYGGPALNMDDTYAVDTGLRPEDAKVLAIQGVRRAFAPGVDVDFVCDLLRNGHGVLRSYVTPLPVKSLGERTTFLPLAYADRDRIRPYSPDEAYAEGGEVIGIEFDVPWESLQDWLKLKPSADAKTKKA
jgi:NhaP-type Na+/H+ or K+/H+ antiporter